MKKFVKILSLVFALCLTLTAVGCNLGLNHKTPTDNGYFYFVEIENGACYEIKAKDVNNLPSNIILPTTYEGKPVTQIAINGFAGSNITKISIPSGYKVIGGYAFSDCLNLSSIEWANTLTTISQGAFSGCTGLYNTIILPDSVTSVETRAFEYCSNLSVVDLGEKCSYYETSFSANIIVNGGNKIDKI